MEMQQKASSARKRRRKYAGWDEGKLNRQSEAPLRPPPTPDHPSLRGINVARRKRSGSRVRSRVSYDSLCVCVCPFLPFSYYPRSMTPHFEIALLIPLFLSRWIINIECNTGYLYIYIFMFNYEDFRLKISSSSSSSLNFSLSLLENRAAICFRPDDDSATRRPIRCIDAMLLDVILFPSSLLSFHCLTTERGGNKEGLATFCARGRATRG